MEQAKILAKARELAKNNHYLQSYLDAPIKDRQKRYQTKLTKNSNEMEKLARIFQEQPVPILTKLNNNQPLHLPPSKQVQQQPLEKHIKEQKRMLEQLQPKTTTKRKAGRPPKQPSITYRLQQEQGLLPTQNLTQNKTYQTNNSNQNQPHQTEYPDNTNVDTTTTTISTIGDSVEPDAELLSRTPTSLADITASIDVITKPTKTQKLSHKPQHKDKRVSKPQKVSRSLTGVEKVSRPLLAIYGERRITSKTSLSLVQVYSQELTPNEIQLLLDNREELRLTHAELVALELLNNMENPENRKQYWKIQETMEKSKKQLTPVSKPESTLLEQKLASAEEAIFGEIIEKPLDNPTPIK